MNNRNNIRQTFVYKNSRTEMLTRTGGNVVSSPITPACNLFLIGSSLDRKTWQVDWKKNPPDDASISCGGLTACEIQSQRPVR